LRSCSYTASSPPGSRRTEEQLPPSPTRLPGTPAPVTTRCAHPSGELLPGTWCADRPAGRYGAGRTGVALQPPTWTTPGSAYSSACQSLKYFGLTEVDHTDVEGARASTNRLYDVRSSVPEAGSLRVPPRPQPARLTAPTVPNRASPSGIRVAPILRTTKSRPVEVTGRDFVNPSRTNS